MSSECDGFLQAESSGTFLKLSSIVFFPVSANRKGDRGVVEQRDAAQEILDTFLWMQSSKEEQPQVSGGLPWPFTPQRREIYAVRNDSRGRVWNSRLAFLRLFG